MSKLRVHEIAKEINVPSKDLVEKLQAKGFDVKNHMSTLSEKEVGTIKEIFSEKKEETKEIKVAKEVKETKDVKPVTTSEAPKPVTRDFRSDDKKSQYDKNKRPPQGKTTSFRDGKPSEGRTTSFRDQQPSGGYKGTKPPYNKDGQNRPPYTQNRPTTQGQTGQSRPVTGTGTKPAYGTTQRPPYNKDRQTGQQGQSQGGKPTYGQGTSRPSYGQGGQRPPYNKDGQGGQRPPYNKDGQKSSYGQGGQRPQTGGRPPFKQDKKPGPTKDFRAEPVVAEKVEKDVKSNYGNRKRDKLKDVKSIDKKEKISIDKVFAKKKGRPQVKRPQKVHVPAPEVKRHVIIEDVLTVQELASQLGKKSTEIIKSLMNLGIMATINESLDEDTIQIIAEEFGATFEKRETKEERLFAEIEDSEESLVSRPPVVTIMGHVDHGKTSLLDKIRSANVIATEAGGITQHIGAYQVEIKKQKITFLDTPGHEAFTQMRARGAQVTDISILVVAADDGVMPQTIEAIHHAKAAKVPIIVAINKIDKPGANTEKIKQELTEHGLVAEDWGGDIIMVPVSAMTGEGIDTLLEMIVLVSEVAELKSNPDRRASGVVIESKLDKGRGSVATVLVQKGTLYVGDFLVAGTTMGKVRAMFDYVGRKIKKAGPSTPVEVLGLSDVPEAGDEFLVAEDEKLAKVVVERKLKDRHIKDINKGNKVTLDDVFAKIKDGEIKDLNIVLKADVQGSIEAIKQSLDKLSNDEVRVNVIHAAVGGIKETDVMLASASNAIIIGFNVRPDVNSRKVAEKESVDIRLYRIIYDAIEDVKAALTGLLSPEIREKDLGSAEVRMIIRVPKVGNIAGSYITEGKFTRNARVRVVRDSVVIFDGSIDALKRFKDDVKEVQAGYECGISIKNYNDFREGDILEAYEMQEIKRELE